MIVLQNKIELIEDALSEDQCKELIQDISVVNCKQLVIELPAVSKKLWGFIKDKVPSYIKGISDFITVSKNTEPVKRHKDIKVDDSKYKLLIYLNRVCMGGTVFYVEQEKYLVKNQIGSIVIFDIEIEHRSELFYNQEKITLGARAI